MRPLSEFDPAWPHGHVQKNGRPARIVGVMKNNKYPIAAIMQNSNGFEVCGEYTLDGYYLDHHRPDGDGRDLVNTPAPKKRVQGWVNVYPGGLPSGLYPDKASADSCAAFNRIACAFVDVEEGEGLS